MYGYTYELPQYGKHDNQNESYQQWAHVTPNGIVGGGLYIRNIRVILRINKNMDTV